MATRSILPSTDASNGLPNVSSVTDLAEAVDSDAYKAPDGGYRAWMVCLSSCLANGTVFGVINTYGILLVKIMSDMDDGRLDLTSRVALIGAIATGITFGLSSASSVFIDTLGLRKTAFLGAVLGFTGLFASSFALNIETLYATFSVVLGLGGSFLYPPSIVILAHYFSRHLGIVNGIVACGSVVISVTESLTLPILLRHVGLAHTFRCLSALYFILIFLVFLWRPMIPSLRKAHDDQTRKKSGHCRRLGMLLGKYINGEIWKNVGYRVWVFGLFVALFGYFVPFTHLVFHVQQVMPDGDGPLLITMCQITSGVSRIVVGKIADIPKINRLRIQQLALALLGVTYCCIPWATQYWHLVILSLIFGACDGAYVCLLSPIVFDIVGPTNLSQSVGFMLSIIALPMMIGPVLAGFMKDQLGNYTAAFLMAGIPPLLGAGIMFFIPLKYRNPEAKISCVIERSKGKQEC